MTNSLLLYALDFALLSTMLYGGKANPTTDGAIFHSHANFSRPSSFIALFDNSAASSTSPPQLTECMALLWKPPIPAVQADTATFGRMMNVIEWSHG